jgi:glycerol-3-phosphate acyltransferase PlsY
MKSAIIFVIAYLISAIPSGYIISKKFYSIDISKYGSGNIGMANIQRVLVTKAALIVFARSWKRLPRCYNWFNLCIACCIFI